MRWPLCVRRGADFSKKHSRQKEKNSCKHIPCQRLQRQVRMPCTHWAKKRVSERAKRILDICIAAQKSGARDLTGREIQARYELQYGGRIDSGTVSARLRELQLADRLVRLPDRLCLISGLKVSPVRVLDEQMGLTA